MKDLNLRPKTIKLLEENIGSKLFDNGLGDDFLDLTPKAKATQKHKKDMNGYIVKIQMAKRYKKRRSASLMTRKMQIKTAMKYHLTPVRMTITKKK